MRVTCPACRKPNDFFESPAFCQRCGADLTSLLAVEQAAFRYRRAALGALHRRDWETAMDHAEQSWSLHRSALAAHIAFLAAGSGWEEEVLVWKERLDRATST